MRYGHDLLLEPPSSASSRPGRGGPRVVALLAGGALALTGCTTGGTVDDAVGPSVAADEQTDRDTGLFDSSRVHDVAVEVDDAAVAAVLEAYVSTGEKEWAAATVVVDGVTYREAGIRLKGNSSLRGVTADSDPSTLPWLVRLDRHRAQDHEGVTSFVVRSSSSTTALEEAVSLELLEAAGLAAQQATPVRFTVGDSDAVLRLVVENPDDAWADAVLGGDGVLYKSEAEGDWSYRGEDPASYVDVFDQETGEVDDLTPLVELLRFLEEADDDAFAAGLAERLDVDAFATYLAAQDLVGNSDDIAGPGNNSYLWWDAGDERFTVVPWDQNLSFRDGFGGPAGGWPGQAPGGDLPALPDGELPALPDGAAGLPPDLPDRTEGGAGARPGGEEGAGRGGAARPGGPGGGGGGPRGGNVLAERFLADDDLASRYEDALTRLESELVGSGLAEEVLTRWTDLLTADAADLVEPEVVQEEAASIRAFLEARSWATAQASSSSGKTSR